MGRLAYPSLNYFPKRLKDEADPSILALAAKIDALILAMQKEVLLESMWRDPARVLAQFLDEMAYYIATPLLNTDSEAQKRVKIKNGVHNLRYLGTWADNVKLIIDGITGFSSSFFNNSNASDWIMFGGGENAVYLASMAGSMGTDGIDFTLGLDLVGAGSEADVAGIFQIDVGTNTLTPTQVSQIVVSLLGFVPCYIRIFLGYTSGTSFVAYAGGQIG